MGAWIETLLLKYPSLKSLVAPRVGAWIETKIYKLMKATFESHPVWVRGLKPQSVAKFFRAFCVAPRVGAWIEIAFEDWLGQNGQSRTPCGCVD